MAENTSAERATSAHPHRYSAELAGEIEARWQDFWEERRTFATPNPGDPGFDPSKPKRFVMDMFPYPSGVGLHVGHPLGYIATDVYARYLRMTGHNVLHPMGYDAFGLPAEQYAIQTGQHPRVTTEANIETMRRQMRRLGLGHDPDRSLATTDLEFYRWTQWIFLQIFNSWYDESAGRARPIAELITLYESGERLVADGRRWEALAERERRALIDEQRLAYLSEIPVNWCPALGTVLANEEVTADGRSERGNYPVYKRPLRQWMMRITAYCERLLRDLEPLDWPEPIKLMQRNWIGRSEGAEVDFLALEPANAGESRKTNDDRSAASWRAEREKRGFPALDDLEPAAIRVFTTRPDTLFGATYMVLAPEHPLVDRLVAGEWPSGTEPAQKGAFPDMPADGTPRELVEAYRRFAQSKSDVERQVETKRKTGVFTGAFASNPVSGERVPIYVADYVLMGYGTGAIMAVPAHDTRDFEFARQFHLPIRRVVRDPKDENASKDYEGESAFTEEGVAVHSGPIDGLGTADAKRTITACLEERGLGRGKVQYRLRDWLFSRQRYWGEPFPILFNEDDQPIAVAESELPVELPEVDDYKPEVDKDPSSMPEPPLARAKDWARVERDGRTYRRELNTMPNWAGSCWYYLRYLDPRNDRALVGPEIERYWMLSRKGSAKDGTQGDARPDRFDPRTCHTGGVDLYVGGAEHAVLHLLYSRFWHKVLFDLGHVSTPEPFGRLFNQGYVQAAAYTDDRGVYVEAERVVEKDGKFYFEGREVQREFGKMGKSLKNAVAPDAICAEYGADTLRLYEMYMGPLEASKPWNTRDIVGVYRFLQRLWRNLVDEDTGELLVTDEAADDGTLRALHRTIDGVTRDMASLGFNTAIAKLIELNNQLVPLGRVPRDVASALIRMLAPLAPHVAEELWRRLGHEESIAYAPFPVADPKRLVADEIEIPVQIRGKVRSRIQVAPGTAPAVLEKIALADPKIAELLAGKTIRKVITVPDRMVNIVDG